MSIKYTEIAKIEHVDGFDSKTGYYAYSKDGKGYILLQDTLLERKEAPLIYWIKASTLMLGMDLLENSNYIRISLHKKTQL